MSPLRYNFKTYFSYVSSVNIIIFILKTNIIDKINLYSTIYLFVESNSEAIEAEAEMDLDFGFIRVELCPNINDHIKDDQYLNTIDKFMCK